MFLQFLRSFTGRNSLEVVVFFYFNPNSNTVPKKCSMFGGRGSFKEECSVSMFKCLHRVINEALLKAKTLTTAGRFDRINNECFRL